MQSKIGCTIRPRQRQQHKVVIVINWREKQENKAQSIIKNRRQAIADIHIGNDIVGGLLLRAALATTAAMPI